MFVIGVFDNKGHKFSKLFHELESCTKDLGAVGKIALPIRRNPYSTQFERRIGECCRRKKKVEWMANK